MKKEAFERNFDGENIELRDRIFKAYLDKTPTAFPGVRGQVHVISISISAWGDLQFSATLKRVKS